MTEGEVTLYADIFSTTIFVPFAFGNVVSLSRVQIPTTTKLYVNKRSTFVISRLNGGFKRKIRTYFADYPRLLEKVNNNEFGRPQIIELL